MQSRPEMPPETAPAPQQEATESERVARILARYSPDQPLPPDRMPALADEVKAALEELAGPAETGPAAGPAPRRLAEEPVLGIGFWKRLVLAAVAAALIVLFWRRLAWFG
jgi:hypothetical protein